ncbi:3899_t:CDS:2 [Ambispora gerdemannii]|uniref:3899_t:CDS:1 n=1 Tax=Ambispora gerdemannii TaxID=144530 RepID=A0A9N8VFH9_9GLOM|nr:3899_t:CDS:2 [Ambispora gerdemannii]
MSKKTTYEEVIRSLELARRLSLGYDYTSTEEKKINPNDGLIIKSLKEKYQNITDEDEWVKFGARMITTAQKELRVVKDKLSEQILADSNQATIRKLIMLSAGGKKEITTVAPEVLKEKEREELSRLRKENKEFLDKIRNLPPSDKEIISFADALDKLEKVARKLIPPMMDVGTQTDLTAEQITQMEKDITKYQQDIQTEQDKVNFLTNQITNLQGEIKNLQEQVKSLEPNKAKKELFYLVEKGVATPLAGTILPDELLERLQNEKLERRSLQTKITNLEKDKNELRTQLDLATKTKEELSKELQKEKGWWESWIRSGIEE